MRATFCEGCDGSGIRAPAEPLCIIANLPPGWMVVERCDSCMRYENDLHAASQLDNRARWITCENGGSHAIIGVGCSDCAVAQRFVRGQNR